MHRDIKRPALCGSKNTSAGEELLLWLLWLSSRWLRLKRHITVTRRIRNHTLLDTKNNRLWEGILGKRFTEAKGKWMNKQWHK